MLDREDISEHNKVNLILVTTHVGVKGIEPFKLSKAKSRIIFGLMA